MAESLRWLQLDSVQKKLAKRWEQLMLGTSEPFSL